MGLHVIGSKKANVIFSMPRLKVREGTRRARPWEDARGLVLKEEGRRHKPREHEKIFPSQTGTNADLTGGVREYLIAHASTLLRIFPSSRGENNQQEGSPTTRGGNK